MGEDRDAGDSGFAGMLAECELIIRKVARSYCWDANLRPDLVQEILLELWRAWPRYDATRPVGAWAYRIALNVAIDYVRSSTRRRPTVELDSETGDGASLERQVDEAIVLERAVKAAEPFDRAILLLFLDGHSQSDIAAIVGTTESNVSTRLHRLKTRLGAHYQESAR
ncbi:RNA polymerase sigma factor [Bradyrhizobium sp. USDA 4473]